MISLSIWISALSLVQIARSSPDHHWGSNVQVKTHTGTYIGLINDTAPDVRQFLNIPYAVPPVDDRRWLPPVAVNTTTDTKIDATKFPPSCPQYASRVPSAYNSVVPEFVAVVTPDDEIKKTSEDCLSLAIWTPTGKKHGLPVIMFMTGGGLQTGGIDIGYQLPYHWVQRTQSHIVVTINYRVNIFGFPRAAGLEDENLGIMDQRLALEWVRDNIEAFGGDPSHITLWGQSAGGESTDIHAFAYHNDPIASSFFMDSGSVFLLTSPADTTFSNFTFVASHLGCSNLSPSAELACMRQVPYLDITNFVGQYADNGTSPSLSFNPTTDDNIIFSNYTDRYSKGLIAPGPALFTTNANEGVTLTTFPKNPTVAGPNQTVANGITLNSFLCPASKSAVLRSAANRTTYRWQFAGNFSNVSPLIWMGAYHSSDLAFTMGTNGDFRGESTSFEIAVSEKMQDYLLAFMKDPVAGPEQVVGWQAVTKGREEDSLIPRFGADGEVVQLVRAGDVDAACYANVTYDYSL